MQDSGKTANIEQTLYMEESIATSCDRECETMSQLIPPKPSTNLVQGRKRMLVTGGSVQKWYVTWNP